MEQLTPNTMQEHISCAPSQNAYNLLTILGVQPTKKKIENKNKLVCSSNPSASNAVYLPLSFNSLDPLCGNSCECATVSPYGGECCIGN